VEHWIEPKALGEFQRTGYNSPLASVEPGGAPVTGGFDHYVNRPGQLSGDHYVNRPGQLAGDHYVNRPGQLAGVAETVKSSLPRVLLGVAVGYFVLPWVIKKIKKGL